LAIPERKVKRFVGNPGKGGAGFSVAGSSGKATGEGGGGVNEKGE